MTFDPKLFLIAVVTAIVFSAASYLQTRSVNDTPEIVPIGQDSYAGNVLVQLSQLPIGDHIQSDFDKFASTKAAYGAFYVSSEGTLSGWGTGYHSQEEADAHARIKCEARRGEPCLVYARLVPADGYEPVALNPAYSRTWRELVKDTENDKFTALAANGWIAQGTSINAVTLKVAQDQAMRLCEEDAVKFSTHLIPAMKRAAEQTGLFECRIVGLKQP